jgi:circadian clock protein KaiC
MGSRTLSSYTNTVKKDASQLEEPAVDDPSKAFVQPDERVKTGIRGLDEILGGGLPAHRLYLIQGAPGTGKTTLAMQFLFEAVLLGQPALYVTLS